MRIISDAFVFPRIAARHHVNLVLILSKPNWRGDPDATLPEGCEADVFLALKLSGDSHPDILRHYYLLKWVQLPLTGLVPFMWIRCSRGRGCVTSQRCANG